MGYSGVLFAWVTVAATASPSFCPLPFLGAAGCLPTVALPLPFSFFQAAGAGAALPAMRFNAAPVVLLVVTSLIMPRVSFVGHLAGIAVGFPLAWGMLDAAASPPTTVI